MEEKDLSRERDESEEGEKIEKGKGQVEQGGQGKIRAVNEDKQEHFKLQLRVC
jgi:hypothetical protein